MMTNRVLWQRAERRLLRNTASSPAKARRIFNALYREARALGVLPVSPPLHGLETDVRVARALQRLARG